MKLTGFTHICREIKDVPMYALLNPESFCVKNLAVRKVFVFFLTLQLPLTISFDNLVKTQLCAIFSKMGIKYIIIFEIFSTRFLLIVEIQLGVRLGKIYVSWPD